MRLILGLLISLISALGAKEQCNSNIEGSTGPESELRIRVRDEKDRPIWARVEVRGPGGRMYHPPGAFHEKLTKARGGEPYYLGSFIMNGTAAMKVPAGKYLIVAEHGLEYERVERVVDVNAGSPASVSLRLRPWIRMREKGWWSGDVHVHHTLEEAQSLVQAEHLNVAVLPTRGKLMDWNDRHGDGVVSVPPYHWIMTRNYEDERRGGAWILDGLRRPLDLRSLGPWFVPGISVVRQARAQRLAGDVFPWFDIDMPIWWEVPVMMALEPPDSLDVIHNQFMQYGIDTSEYWGRPYDRRQFPGREGFVAYNLGLYYRYLNLGFRLPATAGTGSGVMPNPTGYNRVYAQVEKPFTVEQWFRAIREGRSFITNGPVLFFRTRQEGERLKTWVEAKAREPIDRVEIVANGKILKSFVPAAGRRAIKSEFNFDPSGYSWVLARCFLKPGVSIRLAQSSPVYLSGNWDARSDAQYFVRWIDDLIALHVSGATKVTDPTQREELLDLYRRARAFYEARAH